MKISDEIEDLDVVVRRYRNEKGELFRDMLVEDIRIYASPFAIVAKDLEGDGRNKRKI